MNKIKLLYDVVKTLRGKDILRGVATGQIQKDQVRVFYVKNEFEKDLLTSKTKANITTEVDYEGKQVKHQSITEFTNCCHGGQHHKLFKHMHSGGCGGLKQKLTKLAFVLHLLNSLKAEEQSDKSTLVTLEITELPEEIKALLQEKMSSADCCHGHGSQCFMKEFCSIEKGNFSLAMSVNKDNEIEKLVITFEGTQHNEQNEQHSLSINAELQLSE
jgi:phosphoribosylformylglycinamidine (FGAM) synthase-like enzyme